MAKAEKRDWSELPADVLSIIYQKLGAIELLMSVQAVCRSWRQLSLKPHVWSSIELRCTGHNFVRCHLEKIAREAIVRSGGYVERFSAAFIDRRNHIQEDLDESEVFIDILAYLADSTTGLRSLILVYPDYMYSGEHLANVVGRFPLLEELHISNIWFFEEAYTTLMQSCLKLKRLRLNRRCGYVTTSETISANSEAKGIAENMSQLRELQLIGHHMTSEGLHAILDKCSKLESLDIRECNFVDMEAGLLAKLHKIKNLRLPYNSSEDEFESGVPGDRFIRKCSLICCGGLSSDSEEGAPLDECMVGC